MTTAPASITLRDFCSQSAAPVWAIIDGLEASLMTGFFAQRPISICGTARGKDRDGAVWLLRVSGDELAMQLLATLPGDAHWGYLFSSEQPQSRLRAHFRKLLMPASGEAAPLRLCDPRVCLDAFSALEPENLARLFAPVGDIALPLSPQMGQAAGLDSRTAPEVFHDRFVTLTPPRIPAGGTPAGVTLDRNEDARLNALQYERDMARLAYELQLPASPLPAEDLTYIACVAPELVRKYGLDPDVHLRIIAECMLRAGLDFPACHHEARAILEAKNSTPRQKSDALQGWLDRGGALSGRSHHTDGHDLRIL